MAGPTRLEAGRYAAMAGRYAARGKPLHGYGGPLRGSRQAATRLWRAATWLEAGRYAAMAGGPLRPPNHDEASTRCRYAAQVYHTRPKLFYEAQGAAKYVRRIACAVRLPPPVEAVEVRVRRAARSALASH